MLILAAIGPLALAIITGGLGFDFAIVGYLIALAMTFVLALIVDALAPSFGGEKDFVQARSSSPRIRARRLWIAGIFRLHAIHRRNHRAARDSSTRSTLFYLGAPVLKKCAPEKAVGYTRRSSRSARSCIGFVLISLLFSMVVAAAWRGWPASGRFDDARCRTAAGGAGPGRCASRLADAARPVGVARCRSSRTGRVPLVATDRDCVTQKDIDDGTKSLPRPGDDCELTNIVIRRWQDDVRLRLPRRSGHAAQASAEFMIEATRYEGKLDVDRAQRAPDPEHRDDDDVDRATRT